MENFVNISQVLKSFSRRKRAVYFDKEIYKNYFPSPKKLFDESTFEFLQEFDIAKLSKNKKAFYGFVTVRNEDEASQLANCEKGMFFYDNLIVGKKVSLNGFDITNISRENLQNIISSINDVEKENNLSELKIRAIGNTKKILSDFKKVFKDVENIKSRSLDAFLFIEKISSDFNFNEDAKNFVKLVNKSNKRWEYLKFELLNPEDLLDRQNFNPEEVIFHIIDEKYLAVNSDIKSSNQIIIFVFFLLNKLRCFFDHDKSISSDVGALRNLELLFKEIPIPAVLIGESGEAFHYTSQFMNLNILPSDCIDLIDEQSFAVNDHIYNIFRKEYFVNNKKYNLILFNSSTKSISSKNRLDDDLGIITSSLAHELNNPLAGILAALQLISFDESLTEEDIQILSDMEQTTKRCRELIQVFLGFSKIGPNNKETKDIHHSFCQSINLLRYRMVEEGLMLNINYEGVREIEHPKFNHSIFTMTLYMIFSELITYYSRKKLVEEVHTGQINGFFNVSQERAILTIDVKDWWQNLKLPSLFTHLLNVLSVNIDNKTNKVIFEFNNE